MTEKLRIGGRFDEFVPIELVERSLDRFQIRSIFDDAHVNAAGMVHGGFIAALLDLAVAGGGAAAAGGGEKFGVTLSLTINFVAPLGKGFVHCDAHPTGGGSRTKFIDAVVTDTDGNVCATATSTVRIVDLPA